MTEAAVSGLWEQTAPDTALCHTCHFSAAWSLQEACTLIISLSVSEDGVSPAVSPGRVEGRLSAQAVYRGLRTHSQPFRHRKASLLSRPVPTPELSSRRDGANPHAH